MNWIKTWITIVKGSWFPELKLTFHQGDWLPESMDKTSGPPWIVERGPWRFPWSVSSLGKTGVYIILRSISIDLNRCMDQYQPGFISSAPPRSRRGMHSDRKCKRICVPKKWVLKPIETPPYWSWNHPFHRNFDMALPSRKFQREPLKWSYGHFLL